MRDSKGFDPRSFQAFDKLLRSLRLQNPDGHIAGGMVQECDNAFAAVASIHAKSAITRSLKFLAISPAAGGTENGGFLW